MQKLKASVKKVIVLDEGKWGIVVDFVLKEDRLTGKEVLIEYENMEDLNETDDGYLVIETAAEPVVKRGETIKITIRDRERSRKQASRPRSHRKDCSAEGSPLGKIG